MFRMNKPAAAWLLAASSLVFRAGPALGQLGHHRPPPAPSPSPAPAELPVVDASGAWPDPGRTPVPSIPLTPPGQPRPPRTYRGLDANRCAGLAASHSEEAAVIEARRAAIISELPSHRDDPSRQMLIKGLGYESAEARNQDASKALTLFYRLAQIQLQDEVLQRSQAELAEAIRASKDQLDRGLLAGQEVYDLLRVRQADLEAKQVELAGTGERINVTLRGLLGVGPVDGDWMIRPQLDWGNLCPAPNAGEAIGVGLARSPQLLLLRTVVAEVDQSSQSAVEQLLAVVSPLAGATGRVGPAPGLATIVQALKHPRSRRESAEKVRDRARQTLAWRERVAESDIRSAVLNIESGLQEVAVARDLYVLRLDELDRPWPLSRADSARSAPRRSAP